MQWIQRIAGKNFFSILNVPKFAGVCAVKVAQFSVQGMGRSATFYRRGRLPLSVLSSSWQTVSMIFLLCYPSWAFCWPSFLRQDSLLITFLIEKSGFLVLSCSFGSFPGALRCDCSPLLSLFTHLQSYLCEMLLVGQISTWSSGLAYGRQRTTVNMILIVGLARSVRPNHYHYWTCSASLGRKALFLSTNTETSRLRATIPLISWRAVSSWILSNFCELEIKYLEVPSLKALLSTGDLDFWRL